MIIKVYQISTKSDVDPVFDMIAGFGISINTLLNSLLLLRFDGFVQSSALEMLGLEDWRQEWNLKRKERQSAEENIRMLVHGGEPSPNSITTQKINISVDTRPTAPSNETRLHPETPQNIQILLDNARDKLAAESHLSDSD